VSYISIFPNEDVELMSINISEGNDMVKYLAVHIGTRKLPKLMFLNDKLRITREILNRL
jgi:hypothetical protein